MAQCTQLAGVHFDADYLTEWTSRGPPGPSAGFVVEDRGRIKPDIVAPGQFVVSARVNAATEPLKKTAGLVWVSFWFFCCCFFVSCGKAQRYLLVSNSRIERNRI
jgi:hypothetical protein